MNRLNQNEMTKIDEKINEKVNEKINKKVKRGMTSFEALFIVFLVLKLTGNITWSWWWVTAPVWGCMLLFVFVTAFLFVLDFIINKCSRFQKTKGQKNGKKK